MILTIRNSFLGKAFGIGMTVIMWFTMITPYNAFSLTGGPAQPEFNSFTPIGTSDMVDLSSGNFSYNIPLMDIGGFPINLAYSSGVSTDQEASWVGLGWDLSIGQINRQMRGLPDDFEGDEMVYENNIKPNRTWGASFKFKPGFFGLQANNAPSLTLSAKYNNYNGFSLSPSLGMSFDLKGGFSIGGEIVSDENGMSLSPSISHNSKMTEDKLKDYDLKRTAGVSFNSREGLSKVNVSASRTKMRNSSGVKPKRIRGNENASSGSSMSLVDNVYTPTVQPGLNTTNFTFNATLGTEVFGGEFEGAITGFGTVQKIAEDNKRREVRAFGYNNTHKATKKDMKDFNRENDGSFSVNTNNLPITNHSFDIYSVQGQGVSGTFRPFRSQIGYVNDPVARNYNTGGALGAEVALGNLVHVGLDYTNTTSQGYSGVWKNQNDAKNELEVDLTNSDVDYEEVYFKNVGDLAADEDIATVGVESSTFGSSRPIQLELGTVPHVRGLNAKYILKGASSNTVNGSSIFSKTDTYRKKRVIRNQNIVKVRHDEIDHVNTNGLLGFVPNLSAKDHHTAGYIITRNDGARYIYGQALYNTKKEEVTFAVGDGNSVDQAAGTVTYTHGTDNSLNNTKGLDNYYNRVSTPAYAHTYLLTLLASSDYSDLTGDGPTDDDLGSYTKFTYTPDAPNGSLTTYNWKVPCGPSLANYNEGLKTDPDDDKGSYIYGEKEIKYIEKIETKTHLAIFHTLTRQDAKGVISELGTIGGIGKRQLDKIELFSKEDIDASGNVIAGSKPIKTVHFVYLETTSPDQLCKGVPNSTGAIKGKLTLSKVYFTYRNSNIAKYSAYEFNYPVNPDYHLKGYNVWGGFKPTPAAGNPSNPEFNYVEQNTITEKNEADIDVSAWSLGSIDLPSGGRIEIDYESDEYAYVQDKKAMRMFKVCGAGFDENPLSNGFFPNDINEALLYKSGPGKDEEARYLYIELPEGSAYPLYSDFVNGYLDNLGGINNNLVQFRFLLNMTKEKGKPDSGVMEKKDFDYVSGYFELDEGQERGELFQYAGKQYASIKMKEVNLEGGVIGLINVNPISKAGWQFGRSYLSRFIYGHPDQNEGLSAAEIFEDVLLLFDNLSEIFTGPNGLLREKKIARRFIPKKSWIRLCNPDGHKKGGGSRVKTIKMHDNWNSMSSLTGSDQFYGQEYNYDLEDGKSSGVATYEPIGSKENPLVQPVFNSVEKLLAPDANHYVEKPFGESFFPGATVSYARVEVKNLERKNGDLEVKAHATGKVVTEFYTSKDYPVLTDQSKITVREDAGGLISTILNINNFKSIYLSQGYVIHINDMNGKMKSQKVFAEGIPEPISGSEYIYSEHPPSASANASNDLFSNNRGKLNNSVYTLNENGLLEENTLGVELDITNDFREQRTTTQIVGLNGNVGTVLVFVAPVVVPAPIPNFALHRDKVKMASTTKVISTYGILKETIAYDAGSRVSTKNLVWDHQTGEVLVTATTNEYDNNYYSFSYPAFWNYDGMGSASKNTEIEIQVNQVGVGEYMYVVGPEDIGDILVNGDEVLCYPLNSPNQKYYGWVKTTGPGATVAKVIDRFGNPIVGMKNIKVIRSGRRNLLGSLMASAVMMENPITVIGAGNVIPIDFLKYDVSSSAADNRKIINAGAVEFSDDWELQCDCDLPDEDDILNEFVYNRKGVWRALKSYLFLTGRKHTRKSPSTLPDPRNDGFYTSFDDFYKLTAGTWAPASNNDDWTSTSEVTKFSPHGFELENKDALDRHSSAQYGYQYKFPMAVSANSKYSQMGFDGFEDYGFDGCSEKEHFGFKGLVTPTDVKSHTGKSSVKLDAGTSVKKYYWND